MTDHGTGDAFDPAILIEVAGSYLLGATPTLTRREVAAAAGVDLDTAIMLWRSLGFGEVGDDVVAFTEADVEAVRVVGRLTELQVLRPEVVQTFVRAMGRSFSRLADWQVRLLLATLTDGGDEDEDLPLELLGEVVPIVEEVQAYIWRRHLVGAASRILLSSSGDTEALPQTIGFVDIVGYTSASRRLGARGLAAMVEHFEQVVAELVVDHDGQVVKTIGDEVLYTLLDPGAAAELALRLVERRDTDEQFPQVRVGSAHGTVLSRLGDVYGPVVNLASRLTSVARPGRVLLDRDLAALVADDPRFHVERLGRRSVKGYEHLEPWLLRRAR